MASDEKCKSAITVVENLEELVVLGYFIRVQPAGGRVFIFASHPSRSDHSGNGRSLEQAVLAMRESGKEEPHAGHGGK